LEKLGEVFEWQYLAKKVLDEVAYYIDAENSELAEKIFKEKFQKIRYCEIKGAYSPGEIKKILNDKSTFMKFYRRFNETVVRMKQEWKNIKAVEKIWRYFDKAQVFIKSKSQRVPITDYSYADNPFAEAAQERQNLIDAKKKMEVLIDLTSDVLSKAPPGMKEYIQYNLDAFKAVDGAMGIIDKYAGKIENVLVEIDKLFAENDKNLTVKTGDIYKEYDKFSPRENNYDINTQLDRKYGRPR
jgi:hypothetical protein